MRSVIFAALIFSGLQTQAQWIPKESVTITVRARVQYLSDLRGFSHFHLDHIELLSAEPALNQNAVLKLIKNPWGVALKAPENFTLKQACAQAELAVNIPTRDILADGSIYLDTTTEMGWFRCLHRK